MRVDAGDVLVVATGNSWAAKAIRIGEVLRGQSSTENHVVVVHHQTDGVWWGVEGKPGGVGWADLRRYLTNRRTVANVEQPKTLRQRDLIAHKAEAMLGRPYDWAAIAADAFAALGVRDLMQQNWGGQGAPGHVVCSSLAAWLYEEAALARPVAAERFTFPSDWTDFCLDRAWSQPERKTA